MCLGVYYETISSLRRFRDCFSRLIVVEAADREERVLVVVVLAVLLVEGLFEVAPAPASRVVSELGEATGGSAREHPGVAPAREDLELGAVDEAVHRQDERAPARDAQRGAQPERDMTDDFQ